MQLTFYSFRSTSLFYTKYAHWLRWLNSTEGRRAVPGLRELVVCLPGPKLGALHFISSSYKNLHRVTDSSFYCYHSTQLLLNSTKIAHIFSLESLYNPSVTPGLSPQVSFITEASVVGIFFDPVQILGHPGVNSRIVRPGATVAPGHHSNQFVSLVGPLGNQWTTAVPLAGILLAHSQISGAHHVVGDHRRGVVGLAAAHVVGNDGHFNLLQNARGLAVLLQGTPTGCQSVRSDIRFR